MLYSTFQDARCGQPQAEGCCSCCGKLELENSAIPAGAAWPPAAAAATSVAVAPPLPLTCSATAVPDAPTIMMFRHSGRGRYRRRRWVRLPRALRSRRRRPPNHAAVAAHRQARGRAAE